MAPPRHSTALGDVYVEGPEDAVGLEEPEVVLRMSIADAERLAWAVRRYPGASVFRDYRELADALEETTEHLWAATNPNRPVGLRLSVRVIP